MKAYKTVIFIFSVIGMLALLSFSFPEDGVQAGPWHWEFPTLEEVLVGYQEPEGVSKETPEELMARQLQEVRIQEKAQYLDFFKNNQSRIYFPNDDVTLLDAFFHGLDEADEQKMRVVHYGDSQIEEDRISSVLRQNLQDRFGGSGVGLVPVYQSVATHSLGQKTDSDIPRYRIYGDASYRCEEHNRYGVMGQFARLDTTVTVSFYPISRKQGARHSRYFNQATLLAGNIDSVLTTTCKGKTQLTEAGEEIRRIRFTLPDSTTRVSLAMKGHADLYGIMLDGPCGVQVDNVPMRGCSGTIFTGMNSHLLTDYYQKENVKLIIMQYGGNSIPYAKTTKAITNYAKQLNRQIRHMKKVAPDAEILFIGPSDMSTKVKGHMQTYPHLPEAIDSMRNAVLRAGAAYWDLYQVMGGCNSMKKWVENTPALAASDYVHFTRKGADYIGEMLYKSLMLYYDYYEWRQKPMNATLGADTDTLRAVAVDGAAVSQREEEQ